jgi:hypothetical protein
MSHQIKARVIRPHCTQPGCRKCIARGHWIKRKAWRSRKNPARPNNGRK